MPNPVVFWLIICVLLLFGILLFALRDCESAPEQQEPTIQYESTREETAPSHERTQYPNDLPPTGGVRLW